MPNNGGSDSRANESNYRTWCWAFQILPYIEQQNLFNLAKAALPETFNPVTALPIQTYLCPGRSHQPYATKAGGSYPGIAGPKTDYAINIQTFPNNWQTKRPIAAITNNNGTSNTVLVGEKAMTPALYDNQYSRSWDECIYSGGYGGTGRGSGAYKVVSGAIVPGRSGSLIMKDVIGDPYGNDWGSPFVGGCPFAMCDGSVRLINYGMSGTANFIASLYYLNIYPTKLD